MLMDKYFICCEHCFDKIAKKSTASARLWMDLCAVKCQDGYIQVNADNPSIRLLEMNGYVVSTDHPAFISIKINGCMQTDDGKPFFCSQGGYHRE